MMADQNNLRSLPSEEKLLSRESQLMMPPRESQSMMPPRESQSMVPPRGSQSTMSSRESQSLVPPRGSQSVVPPRESQSMIPSRPSGNNADGMPSQRVTNPPVKPFVWLVALCAALGGLLFGYDIGGSGGTFVMEGFRAKMGWPGDQHHPSQTELQEQGWITAVFAIGAMFGALPSGLVADRFGRRACLLVFSALFTLGAALMASTTTIAVLYSGRFISGLAVGALSMIVTMYQSELAPEHIRGILVTLQQLCVTFGILLAACLNLPLSKWDQGWRISYAGNGFFSILMFCLFLCLPESPRWLISKDRVPRARVAMRRVWPEELVETEIETICAAVAKERAELKSSWRDVFSRVERMRYRTFVGVGLQFLQQFTGINAIMYFAPAIFTTGLGMSAESAIIANLILQAVNFLSTFLCIALIEKAGRRILLVSGAMGMAVTTAAVAVLASDRIGLTPSVGYGIVACCALYIIFFAYSWGPVVWVVCAEIYPQNTRSKAMTLTTTANWVTNFIIAKVTPLMYQPGALNLWGTFTFFCCACVIMGLFVYFFLPETKGVALEHMTANFEQFSVCQKGPKRDPKLSEVPLNEMGNVSV